MRYLGGSRSCILGGFGFRPNPPGGSDRNPPMRLRADVSMGPIPITTKGDCLGVKSAEEAKRRNDTRLGSVFVPNLRRYDWTLLAPT